MLRASSHKTETEIDLKAVGGDVDAAAIGVEFGPQLMLFAEAVARRDAADIENTRNNLLQVAGEAVLVDAAGVAANFQRMVRIADSMGIPLDDEEVDHGEELKANLDLTSYASAANTLQV